MKIWSQKLILCCYIAVIYAANGFAQGQKEHSPVLPVVEIKTAHDHMKNQHVFQIDQKEISSGWTTFNLVNASPFEHFFVLFKVPEVAIQEAATRQVPVLDYWHHSITTPFQEAFNPYIKGEMDYETFVEKLVEAISKDGSWFFEPGAPAVGGAGLTSSGAGSQTTLYLEPGQYLVECYLKDGEELFHSYLGMIDLIEVTENPSNAQPPQPTAKVSISSSNGIKVHDPLVKGQNVVELYFEDQSVYEHLLGHNLQLVKLGERTDQVAMNDLAKWMDWTQPGALANQAPHGMRFLGGSMEMESGATSYYHVDLAPGRYAWIAEVPDPEGKKMMVMFTVE